MMNKDWQHLQSLFHEALSLKVEDRAAYLAHKCVEDVALREKVEALIEASEKQEDFLEQPALSLGMRVLSSDSTEELTGQVLGSFKILSLLGNGGMGDVYLAQDAQLGRKVALKFLSAKLVGDQWAKRQFTKEAQAVAMLDHPNICTVYGFEETDGHSFIIMQYVEGERLDQVIQKKELEPSEMLFLAIQIASALSEAHAHGIIHRDIKPSNIMVTANRQLKVLDFGLAKLVKQPSWPSADEPSSNSLQLGFIPGTISYMSPEQLRGQRLDYGTDIFSFGVVFYEMISGKNPFAHDNKAETISSILVSQPPPVRSSAPNIPREFERLLQKCLEKEASERYQSVNELLVELEAIQKLIDGERRRPWYTSVRAAAALTLLLLLIIVSTFIYSYLTRPHAIAILPFANETGDVSLDYLSDGLTENIIGRLSGLSKVRVKAFSMVSGYKGRQLDPQKIGRDLNVDIVVFGKLSGTKDSLSLQTVMINTADGSQLWTDSYKAGGEELFHTEEDVSRQIISKLELWPGRDEDRLSVKPRARNPEAYDQFMLGRYYWRFRDKTNIPKAIDHFQEAIKLDPLYAQAYAGLADSYVLLNTAHYGNILTTREAMEKAEYAANTALELDPNLPEAHTSVGVINFKRHWNWPEAEKAFKRAIEINSNFAPAHYWYSHVLAITGRQREAITESELANSLDPFSPLTNLNYCRSFYYARDNERAAACFERLVKDHPDYKNGQYVQGLVYLSRGMYQDATRIFEKLYAADKSSAGAVLGYTYGVTGRRDDALKVLAEMEALKSDQSDIPPQEFAIIYMGLGDKDRAFAWLKKAADEHFAPLAFIGVDPLFDSIRSDARFADLYRSLKLP
ncbi:MAG: eukaryotic-like serine/threonine-protein kinase [Acidobacteriota bacterium]|nr:eukaryotic-like serine/threonine-protein kinase [Acidobacteriota bacterium]